MVPAIVECTTAVLGKMIFMLQLSQIEAMQIRQRCLLTFQLKRVAHPSQVFEVVDDDDLLDLSSENTDAFFFFFFWRRRISDIRALGATLEHSVSENASTFSVGLDGVEIRVALDPTLHAG